MKDSATEYPQMTLRDLGVQAQTGFASGANTREAVGVVHLRPMNVSRSGRLDTSDVKYVADTRGRRVANGDVLFNNTNSSALVGKTAFVGSDNEFAFSNHMTRLRVDIDLLDARYLAYRLHSMWEEGYFQAICANHVNQASVSTVKLLDVRIPVPLLEEQRRIVGILEDHLSRLDAANRRVGDVRLRLEVYENSMLATFPDAESRLLQEVAEIQGGIQKQQKRTPKENQFPFLRVANVTKDGLDLGEIHQIELFPGELKRYGLKRGDLLVVEGNGSASQIGRAALWDGSIVDCTHQNHLIRVRPSDALSPNYLEAVWNSSSHRRQLRSMASSSSGLHTLSVSKLKSLSIPVPPRDRQDLAMKGLSVVREARGHLDAEIQRVVTRSSRLRRAILEAAFSGRLTGRASDVDTVEEMAGV